MKKLLLFILLITSTKIDAQNYQCLQAGVKRYFIDSSGYLRGMRIDSVRTQGSNTLYYPFHTLRGRGDVSLGIYPNTIKGSWLGEKAIQDLNGNFMFMNYFNDTVFINTQASIGNNWIFYNDTSSKYYTATLVSMDTMTVLGVIDSIKKITINAYTGTTILNTDPANNFQIILSKDHGFLQIFDLYTFPYDYLDSAGSSTGWDNYLEKIKNLQGSFQANSTFNLVDYHIPTYQELHSNWNVGDIYSYYNLWTTNINTGLVPPNFTNDTIVGKTVFTDSTVFTIHYSYYDNSAIPTGGSVVITTGTGLYCVHNIPHMDTTYMPEEMCCTNWGYYAYHYYYPNDTAFGFESPSYLYKYDNYIFAPLTLLLYDSTEKTGIGPITMNEQDLSIPLTADFHLLRCYRNGQWYNYMGAEDVQKVNFNNNDCIVFPNPANNNLHIQFNKQENCTVSIINMMGQVVLYKNCNATEVVLNTSDISAGMYDIKIQTEKGAVSHQKIVLIH
ncbi:MAG: T9SS type A sorting domain-containing protein [Bacteroidota bacterium]